LLVLLDTLAGGGGRGPLEVHSALNFHGGTSKKVHVGEFVNGERLALEHTSNEFLIRGPLESGPLDLLLGRNLAINLGRGSQIVGHERTEGLSSLDIPDNNVLAVLLVGQNRLTFFNLDRAC
jgi:hypothetical protein